MAKCILCDLWINSYFLCFFTFFQNRVHRRSYWVKFKRRFIKINKIDNYQTIDISYLENDQIGIAHDTSLIRIKIPSLARASVQFSTLQNLLTIDNQGSDNFIFNSSLSSDSVLSFTIQSSSTDNYLSSGFIANIQHIKIHSVDPVSAFSLELFFIRRLEIEMFELAAVEYDNASFLCVHRIDKHTFCHKAVAP